MPITLDPKSFHAHLDEMPPRPPRLVVEGKGEAPTTGWTAELVPAKPQGINPEILILDVVAHAPGGIEAQHVTPIALKYEEKPARHYTNVTIRNGAEHFTIKVEITV